MASNALIILGVQLAALDSLDSEAFFRLRRMTETYPFRECQVLRHATKDEPLAIRTFLSLGCWNRHQMIRETSAAWGNLTVTPFEPNLEMTKTWQQDLRNSVASCSEPLNDKDTTTAFPLAIHRAQEVGPHDKTSKST